MPEPLLTLILRTLADDAARTARPAGLDDVRHRAHRRTLRRGSLATVAVLVAVAGTAVLAGGGFRVQIPQPAASRTDGGHELPLRSLEQAYPRATTLAISGVVNGTDQLIPVQLTADGDTFGLLRPNAWGAANGRPLHDHAVVVDRTGHLIDLHAPDDGWTGYNLAGDRQIVAGIDVPTAQYTDHGSSPGPDTWRVWCRARTGDGGAGPAVLLATVRGTPTGDQGPPALRVRKDQIELVWQGHRVWTRCSELQSLAVDASLGDHPIANDLFVIATPSTTGRYTLTAVDGTGHKRHLTDTASPDISVNAYGLIYTAPGTAGLTFAPWGGTAQSIIATRALKEQPPGSDQLPVPRGADPGSPVIAIGATLLFDTAQRRLVQLPPTDPSSWPYGFGPLVAGRYLFTADPGATASHPAFHLVDLGPQDVPARTFADLTFTTP